MLVAELFDILTQHPGREYRATMLTPQVGRAPQRRGAAATVLPGSAGHSYLFVRRGEQIEATGPSGQRRLLSPKRFGALFAQAHFTAVTPTGRLSDLGPLFTQERY